MQNNLSELEEVIAMSHFFLTLSMYNPIYTPMYIHIPHYVDYIPDYAPQYSYFYSNPYPPRAHAVRNRVEEQKEATLHPKTSVINKENEESRSEPSEPIEDERSWYIIKRRNCKRIYLCTACSKEFTRTLNLKDHYNATHLNLKPYKCLVGSCNSRFARKNDCTRHMKMVHGKSIKAKK
jgi:uncharacterized Zn-finger protein